MKHTHIQPFLLPKHLDCGMECSRKQASKQAVRRQPKKGLEHASTRARNCNQRTPARPCQRPAIDFPPLPFPLPFSPFPSIPTFGLRPFPSPSPPLILAVYYIPPPLSFPLFLLSQSHFYSHSLMVPLLLLRSMRKAWRYEDEKDNMRQILFLFHPLSLFTFSRLLFLGERKTPFVSCCVFKCVNKYRTADEGEDEMNIYGDGLRLRV